MLETAIEYKQPELAPGIDIRTPLGVEAGAEPHVVDAAWYALAEDQRDEQARFAWKVLRDPAYTRLFDETGSVAALYDAGFFIDNLPVDAVNCLEHTAHDWSTPYHKLAANLESLGETEQPPVVLVTTGGFSPVHYGHLMMMETAKKALEAQGRSVVAGYFSPSHDDYVGQKYGGEAKLEANHRTHIIQTAILEEEGKPGHEKWLMVDPWESQYVRTDINFTDVIRHLKGYLAQFATDRPLDVMYVCGADNAGFANVLKYMDGGVCVSRGSNYNETPPVFTQPDIAADPRLLFVRSDDPSSDFSSASVRGWNPQYMPAEASKEFFDWRLRVMSGDGDVTLPKRNLFIRDDGGWAMHQYYPDGPTYDVIQGLERFKTGIDLAIQQAFSEVELPDVPREIAVHFLPLHEHRELADKLAAERPVLNLDACTNDGQGLNFSRLFEMGDGQLRPSRLVPRPGFPEVDEQFAAIEPGEYMFLDDDYASGATFNHVMAMLPEGVSITSLRTLLSQSMRLHKHLNEHELDDMDDLRDFIVGSRASGLVVPSPRRDSLVRAPYLLPFISGYSRSSVPLSSMRDFSQTAWRLNAELFESFDRTLTLANATPEAQVLFGQLGFDLDTPMAAVARYYEQWLNHSRRRAN